MIQSLHLRPRRLANHDLHYHLACAALIVASLLIVCAAPARAATWNNIEPFKSRRADVERALGTPIEDKAGETGTLKFRVAGGTVTVAFVTRRFIETKKLNPALEGTVMVIVLQHDNASDTPESLSLTKNNKFEREQQGEVTVFNNTRDGIFYTFVGNRLKTTRYASTAEQQTGAQKGS